jgi:hypothetical protein
LPGRRQESKGVEERQRVQRPKATDGRVCSENTTFLVFRAQRKRPGSEEDWHRGVAATVGL